MDPMRAISKRRHCTGFHALITLLACALFVPTVGAQIPSGRGTGNPINAFSNDKPRESQIRSAQPQFGPTGPTKNVVNVVIKGISSTARRNEVQKHIETRIGRPYDPELVQSDVRRLIKAGQFQNVRTTRQNVRGGGVVVVYEFVERSIIRYVRIEGNEKISDSKLLKESGLKIRESLDPFVVQEAQRKIVEYYHSKGFGKARVQIKEGGRPGDKGVALMIHEGQRLRIWRVDVVGNSEIVSAERLKATVIKSKPGYLKVLFRGNLDRQKIEEDLERITVYYRNLGFMRAKVGRDIDITDDGKWAVIRFVIIEGPRSPVRNIRFEGNERFDGAQLAEITRMKPGDFFDRGKLDQDVREINDLYGSKGYIQAKIVPEPVVQDAETGLLDLVYSIQEGSPYRAGHIEVRMGGSFPHTRESVVRDRVSIRPGDILDSREIRNSERRLMSAQLFRNEPQRGVRPTIAIRPPSLDASPANIARKADSTYRGQSPTTSKATPPRRPAGESDPNRRP